LQIFTEQLVEIEAKQIHYKNIFLMTILTSMLTMRGRRQRACILLILLAAPGFCATNATQVVVVPVANMYSAPSDKSDVVSQAIYGSNVTLLSARGEWSKVQTDDHYRGWTPSRYLRLVQSGEGYATAGPTVEVESLFANIYGESDVARHKPIVTIPFESHLEVIAEGKGNDEGWLQVRLPDKRSAWIQSGDVVANPKPLTIPESIELAKRFLGLPYLWGGRSSYGFDCSGFTQMLVRARGVNMPRDADKQAAWKGVTPVERKELQPGDLIFFGSAPSKITHTGMYIGDSQFIHDATNGRPAVQISRLDDPPWTRLLVACRRVKVPSQSTESCGDNRLGCPFLP
jgi:cell wall-associated NlpC family hydrolase